MLILLLFSLLKEGIVSKNCRLIRVISFSLGFCFVIRDKHNARLRRGKRICLDLGKLVVLQLAAIRGIRCQPKIGREKR
jgi:hypothetical protein